MTHIYANKIVKSVHIITRDSLIITVAHQKRHQFRYNVYKFTQSYTHKNETKVISGVKTRQTKKISFFKSSLIC